MPIPPRAHAATWRCCYRCGTLYTPAHPCPCRPLAHEEAPSPRKSDWPLLVVAVLCLVLLFILIGWRQGGC